MDNSTVAPGHLVIYGHSNCGSVRGLTQELDNKHIEYEYRDVLKGEPRFADELRALARGYLSVPTVVFPNGKVMVEPFSNQVLKELEAQAKAAQAEPARQKNLLERILKAR